MPKKIIGTPVIGSPNKTIITCSDFFKDGAFNVPTELDFITFGINPRGDLLIRASKILLDFNKLEVTPVERNFLPLKAAYGLVKRYVSGQEHWFNPSRMHLAEDWFIKKIVSMFMESLKRFLGEAVEFRNQLESGADNSEMYSVALEIIHEFEIYCSHKTEIAKYVKAQRKFVDAISKELFTALKKRDGLFCRVCMSTANLQIDHIMPLALGGTSILENLQILCRSCNSRKGDRPMSYLIRRTNKLRDLVIN